MKRRIISLICAFAVVLSTSACNSAKDTEVTTVATTSVTTVSESGTTSVSTEETTVEAAITEKTTAAETTIETEHTTASATAESVTATAETTTVTEAVTTTATSAAAEAVTTAEATTTTVQTTTTAVTTTEATTTTTAAETTTTAAETEKKPEASGDFSAMSTAELVKDMGIGINLGNTYESCGDWIAQWGDGTPESYETAWGSPVITKKMIQGYKDAGFGVLRVPVAWSNLMGDDYTLSPEYIETVREVVDWAIECDLYVIINLHYDNGWLEKFPTETEECMYRYTRIWTQVCEAFKDYDEHLIFESQNEELGWSSVWNPWGGTSGKKESFELVNEINQTFVDIVRASGGNNPERHLLISGYTTSIDHTCDKLFEMPDDPAGRCAVSVHYYTPSDFAILTEDADWGKARSTWGTDADFQLLDSQMDMMRKNFVDKGIPVIIGEYGCPTLNKDEESVRLYISSVCEAAYSRGMCPVLWSTPGEHYDRGSCKMIDEELGSMLKEIQK